MLGTAVDAHSRLIVQGIWDLATRHELAVWVSRVASRDNPADPWSRLQELDKARAAASVASEFGLARADAQWPPDLVEYPLDHRQPWPVVLQLPPQARLTCGWVGTHQREYIARDTWTHLGTVKGLLLSLRDQWPRAQVTTLVVCGPGQGHSLPSTRKGPFYTCALEPSPLQPPVWEAHQHPPQPWPPKGRWWV